MLLHAFSVNAFDALTVRPNLNTLCFDQYRCAHWSIVPLIRESLAAWLFISFALAAKETEPKKKAGLHLQSYYFRSKAKASELATLKQPILLHAFSVNTLHAPPVRPNFLLSFVSKILLRSLN